MLQPHSLSLVAFGSGCQVQGNTVQRQGGPDGPLVSYANPTYCGLLAPGSGCQVRRVTWVLRSSHLRFRSCQPLSWRRETSPSRPDALTLSVFCSKVTLSPLVRSISLPLQSQWVSSAPFSLTLS